MAKRANSEAEKKQRRGEIAGLRKSGDEGERHSSENKIFDYFDQQSFTPIDLLLS